ncbi:hypothetical protein VTK73DRAFT_2460 [Phialemonium thermophilum]|uniref:Helicase ATP-binding domain-containing protein n=1 Tax=Phialemonium thermophilum TaxID=223376 RepID=A0ABR3VS43_9PEZI
MHGQQKLDRVVVDECYTVLQYSKTFRLQMGRLGEALQDFGVPVVGLTATLKKQQESALFCALRFVPERVQMFREATTRPNIRYRVDVIEEEEEDRSRWATGKAGGRTGRGEGKGRRAKVVRETEEGEEEGEADEALVERVCKIVRAWTARHETGKVIMYGGTVKRVQEIASELGCMAYWREAGNAAEKAWRVAE